MLDQLSGLKVLVRVGIGIDSVDLEYVLNIVFFDFFGL